MDRTEGWMGVGWVCRYDTIPTHNPHTTETHDMSTGEQAQGNDRKERSRLKKYIIKTATGISLLLMAAVLILGAGWLWQGFEQSQRNTARGKLAACVVRKMSTAAKEAVSKGTHIDIYGYLLDTCQSKEHPVALNRPGDELPMVLLVDYQLHLDPEYIRIDAPRAAERALEDERYKAQKAAQEDHERALRKASEQARDDSMRWAVKQ